MYISKLVFFFHKAIQNLRKGSFVNFINIGTITITLLILSIFLMIYINLGQLLDGWKNVAQITVYLNDDISVEETTTIRKKIAGSAEVASVKYISKKDALKILKKTLQPSAVLMEELDHNPLPASIEVQLKREFLGNNKIKSFVPKIKGLKNVAEVSYDQEWTSGVSAFLNLFRVLSLTLGVGLVLAAVFIISNTIGLSVYARRKELEIMRLVGATNLFIKTPFLLEGLLQGLMGSLLSLGLLFTIYHVFIWIIGPSLSLWAGRVNLCFLPGNLVIFIILGGMCVGILGSMVSLRKFLKI